MAVCIESRGRSRSVSSIPYTPAERVANFNRIVTQQSAFDQLQDFPSVHQQCLLTIDVVLASLVEHRPSQDRTNRITSSSSRYVCRTVKDSELSCLNLLTAITSHANRQTTAAPPPPMIARMLPAALELSSTALDIMLLTQSSFPRSFNQYLILSQSPNAVQDLAQTPTAGVIIAKHLLKRYSRVSKNLCNHIDRFHASRAEWPTAATADRVESSKHHTGHDQAKDALMTYQVRHQNQTLQEADDRPDAALPTLQQPRLLPQDARYWVKDEEKSMPIHSSQRQQKQSLDPRWLPPAPRHFYSRRASQPSQARGPHMPLPLPPPPPLSPPRTWNPCSTAVLNPQLSYLGPSPNPNRPPPLWLGATLSRSDSPPAMMPDQPLTHFRSHHSRHLPQQQQQHHHHQHHHHYGQLAPQIHQPATYRMAPPADSSASASFRGWRRGAGDNEEKDKDNNGDEASERGQGQGQGQGQGRGRAKGKGRGKSRGRGRSRGQGRGRGGGER